MSYISIEILLEDVPLVIDRSFKVPFVFLRGWCDSSRITSEEPAAKGENENFLVYLSYLQQERKSKQQVPTRATRQLISTYFLLSLLAFSPFFRTKFLSLNFVASRRFLWQHLDLKLDFITKFLLKGKTAFYQPLLQATNSILTSM